MTKLLTTKDLAEAIGASESSLRRWTDSGAIRTARTPGGHRRIPLADAIHFIRQTHAAVVKPEILGLPDMPQAADDPAGTAAGERLHAALLEGDAAKVRGQIVAMYLSGLSVAWICDGPLCQAMHCIGELWRHSPRGILIEHRATDLCIVAISALRDLLREPAPTAPLGLGATPPGDPYILPSAMAAAVLAEAGWREVNYGPEVPLELLGDAARERGARLVWLSISAVTDPASLRRSVRKLAEAISCTGAAFAIGGRFCKDVAALHHTPIHFMQTMTELSAFARGIQVA